MCLYNSPEFINLDSWSFLCVCVHKEYGVFRGEGKCFEAIALDIFLVESCKKS